MPPFDSASRRRRWPYVLVAIAVVGAGSWAGGWYAAAGKVETVLAGWKDREARSGRVYSCASQSIGGFPFRIEVRCTGAGAIVRVQEPLSFTVREIAVTADVLKPTVLSGEIFGPMTVGDRAQPAVFAARWVSARTEVHGLPMSPEDVMIRVDRPVVERLAAGGPDLVFNASRVEIKGHMLEGSARANPVIQLTFKLADATAPQLHTATERPTNAEVTAVLRGLQDFAPKPWPERFRELQAAGGRIEVTRARVQQGDTIMVANGVLGLSPSGRLDGELQVTVANLQQMIPVLGLDKLTAPDAAPNRVGNALSALDQVIPGLGGVARRNAGPALMAGLVLLGKPTQLEGRRAVTLPLRFNDGAVALGALPVGHVPPLY